MQLLSNVFEKSLENAGMWRENALNSIPLYKISWRTEHRNKIASMQISLYSAIKMSFQKHGEVARGIQMQAMKCEHR